MRNEPETHDRSSAQHKVRKLLRGKYKDSCAPCSSVTGELRNELNAIGVAECDHLIAVMNMSPNDLQPNKPPIAAPT
jgi:hypothetical protein